MGYLDETGLSRVWNRIKAYIQSLNYTSNIGTVTGITMNNTSYSPVDGDVDLGFIVTSVNNLTGAVTITTGDTNLINEIKLEGELSSLSPSSKVVTIPKATSSAAGLMPALDGANSTKFLKGDGTWDTPAGGGGGGGDENVIESITFNGDNIAIDENKNAAIVYSQAQADWEEDDSTSDAYIQNKPTIPTVPSGLVTGVNSSGTAAAYTVWVGTLLQYDNILTKDSSTLYFIKGV